MKKIGVYEKIRDKIKKHWDILIWWGGILVLSAYSAYYTNQFSYDDVYLIERFTQYKEQYGVLQTIIREFLNMDLATIGEIRFYGLSKAIHVIVYLFAGEHVWVYQAIMISTHFAMSVLLYKILTIFCFDNNMKFMCMCAWCFSPFAHVQTFHHFSYLFLPLYLVMGYLYFNLKNLCSRKKEYVNIVLIFCCVFTGENTIPLLGLIMLSFVVYGICIKDKDTIKKYVRHLSCFKE